jgi:cell division protein YceG involved in septum cleavage
MIRQVNKKFWRTFFTVFLDALLIVAIVLIFFWMRKVGFYSFSNRPYQKENGKVIEIQIKEKETVKDLARQLEERGVIEDDMYLRIRYRCSSYYMYNFRPGEYQVSPSMGVDDLLDEFTGQ